MMFEIKVRILDNLIIYNPTIIGFTADLFLIFHHLPAKHHHRHHQQNIIIAKTRINKRENTKHNENA